MRQELENLEVHVADSCNLFCESCSHFSNHGHQGVLGLQEAEAWLGPWSVRVKPGTVSLVGGEPTLNPDLAGFVRLARRMWPESLLRLVTNGFFLHRHPELPQALKEAGHSVLQVSIHHEGAEYMDRLRPELDLVSAWVREFGLVAQVNPSIRHWARRYLGTGAGSRPFEDDDPRASWEICPDRACPQVFRGKLWKCPPLAYLQHQKGKFDLDPAWDPYLAYRPLSPDCSEAELAAWIAREDESHCAMCPSTRIRFTPPNPMHPQDRARRGS